MQFHKDGLLPPPNEDSGENWVFVFGSNLAGRHGAGAARAAHQYFGAEMGTGEGFTGDAYALPTKDRNITTLSFAQVRLSVRRFLDEAKHKPGHKFFVTRIGCGLAGFKDRDIAPLFRDAVGTFSFAEEWRAYLQDDGLAGEGLEKDK